MGSMIENFDPLARLLLEALLNTLWQGMLIAALVWLSLRFTKRASATTRHAVWLVSLLTIGALPFIAVMAKRGDSPAGSTVQLVKQETARPAIQNASSLIAPETNQFAHPFLIENEIARLNSPVRQIQPGINGDISRAPQFSNDTTIVTLDESSKAVPSVALVASKVEKKSFWQRARTRVANIFGGALPLLLVGLWLAGCALMLWRIARSYRAVFRMRRQFGFLPPPHRERIERLAGMFGIKRRVRAFASEQVSMPMTIGSFRPLIILPPDLVENLAPSEFESVVAHELAHIKRWDYLTNLLQRIAQSFLFFHPAVWFIGKQLMIERELACDDWAVKTCEPRRYANCLTKLVELLSESRPLVAATGILFGKHVISRRVEMILNRDRNATTAVSKPALLYAIGLVVLFVAVFGLISPVIAVPLGQKPAKPGKKEGKAATATQSKSQAVTPLPPLPPPDDRLMELPEPPEIPEPPEMPEPPAPPAAAVIEPGFELIEIPKAPAIAATPGAIIQPTPQGFGVAPVAPAQLVQPGRIATTPRPMPAPDPLPPLAGVLWQDYKNKQPTIPETELLNVLVDIVKRDADPNVRNEALQGIYRLRSDAAINALIQLYDSTSDVKVKGEIVGYLLRREGPNSKVDNSKAIAKLTSIAKSEQNEELRNKAIRYLGNVKGDEGANTLIQIYDGLQDQKMKQYVIRSLAYNKSRKAIDKLIQIAKSDSDPVVRQYAIRSLYGIDSRLYLELVDRPGQRIGLLDRDLKLITPRAFEFDGKKFEFDAKKWEEWQKDWQKNWQEQQEKLREMLEKLRIEDLDKLRLELPKIELQLNDLKDRIRIGQEIESLGAVESQLRLRLAEVEAQLASMQSQFTATHPKLVGTRNLRNALERQLSQVRSMRTRSVRPARIRTANTNQSSSF